jgi:hypothetical protein
VQSESATTGTSVHAVTFRQSCIVVAPHGKAEGRLARSVAPADRMQDCGECVYCLDKPKYGGPGTKRQKCVLKQNEVSHATRIVPAALKTSSWPTRTSALRARETLRKCIVDEGSHDKQRASSSVTNVIKRHRCGVCVGCNATNCGRCVYCLDMLQFGGTGNLRQSCIERRCVEITKEDERLAEERRVEREAERELRQAEREAEREARAAERTERGGGARRFGGSTVAAAAAAAVAKHTGFMPGTNARLPSVRLEASIDSGWGQFEFLQGMRVEVINPQEDVLGLMAGRVVDPYSEQPPPPKSSSSPRRTKSGPRHANPAAAEAAVAAAAAAHSAVVEAAVQSGKVCVEYDELLSEAHLPMKVPLREFIEPQRLRMLPPSAFPKGAACLLRPGDQVDMYYEDGWWDVVIQAVEEPAASDGLERGQRRKRQRGKARKSTQAAVAAGDGGGSDDGGGAPEAAADTRRAQSGVVDGDMDAKVAAPGDEASEEENLDEDVDEDEDEDTRDAKLKKKSKRLFHVKAVLYDIAHQVGEERLRPKWLWSHERRVWRYELACGHGCVPLEGHGRPSFVFAGGAPRSWNPHYEPIVTTPA